MWLHNCDIYAVLTLYIPKNIHFYNCIVDQCTKIRYLFLNKNKMSNC